MMLMCGCQSGTQKEIQNQFDRLGPLEERNSSVALKNFCKTLTINSQIHILGRSFRKDPFIPVF